MSIFHVDFRYPYGAQTARLQGDIDLDITWPDGAPELPPLPEDVLGPPEYLGALRISNTGIDETIFTYGGLAGRNDGGTVKLYITGNQVGSNPERILEIIDPGSGYDPNPNLAPIATTNVYENNYRDKRYTWRVGGGEVTDYFPGTPAANAGLYWDDATSRLFLCYEDIYDTGGLQTHGMLSIQLHAGTFTTTGYGPWSLRTIDGDGTIRRGPKGGMWLSKHPTTGKMMVSSTLTSGNAGCTWGPSYHTGANFPVDSTPVGSAEVWNIPNLALWYHFMGFDPAQGGYQLNIDGSLVSGHSLRSFRRALNPSPYEYFPEDACSPADNVLNVDPALYSGVGSWTSLERSYGMMYIQIGSKAVYLSTALLCDGHTWYRNACRLLCNHGQSSPVDVTGPTTTSAFPAFIGYDPETIAEALAGNIEDWEAEPAYCVNMDTQYPGIRTAPIGAGGFKQVVMGWFDSSTRKLYLHAVRADRTRSSFECNQPSSYCGSLIHVFQWPEE